MFSHEIAFESARSTEIPARRMDQLAREAGL
jgi:hypothetical protein